MTSPTGSARAARPRSRRFSGRSPSRIFSGVDALKEYLISAISIARREKYRGAIADFRPPEFDPGYPFLVLGRGSLGGKGRGLAFVFRQLSRWLKDDCIQGVRMRLPCTLVIGADESDFFLKDNAIDVTKFGGLSDDAVLRRFAEGQLSRRLAIAWTSTSGGWECPSPCVRRGCSKTPSPAPGRVVCDLHAAEQPPGSGVRLDHLETAVKLVYARLIRNGRGATSRRSATTWRSRGWRC